MNPGGSYRGQPLVALMLLIGGWIVMRAAVLGLGVSHSPMPAAAARTRHREAPALAQPPAAAFVPAKPKRRDVKPIFFRLPPPHSPVPRQTAPAMAFSSPARTSTPAGLQLIEMEALSDLPLPVPGPTPPTLAPPSAEPRASRWSGDGWLLLRRGGTVPASGLAPASYGASQLGAALRYRLAQDDPHRPTLYLRASAALNGSREREAALGLSARPIARLPIVLAAEARVNAQPGRTRARPAAFAYTAMPPARLPLGARAEVYGQAGYVGGDFATAFADGQLRVDHAVATVAGAELRAGGGAWGGAQKGASRLDVGPSATVALAMGGSAGVRLGFDWRFRVAGNAAPASGPALTLSAGF